MLSIPYSGPVTSFIPISYKVGMYSAVSFCLSVLSCDSRIFDVRVTSSLDHWTFPKKQNKIYVSLCLYRCTRLRGSDTHTQPRPTPRRTFIHCPKDYWHVSLILKCLFISLPGFQVIPTKNEERTKKFVFLSVCLSENSL